MPLFQIKVDTRQMAALERLFKQIGEQKPVAIRRAVNRTGDQLATKTVKIVAKQIGVTQRSVKKYLSKGRASPGRSAVYRITASAPAMSLKEFNPRQTSEGVVVKVWGQRRVLRQVFISPALGGHVFVREWSGDRRAGRKPLKKLWGPVLANEIARGEMVHVHKLATEELPKRIAHEIDAILKGYAPRGKI